MYCAAHTAQLGNIFQGAGRHLALNQAAIDEGTCRLPGEADRALVNYGLEVARESGPLSDDVLPQLNHHFTPDKVEKIVLVATSMGLLNRCMDSLGMVLEAPMLESASRALTKTGWDQQAVYDGRYDEELLEADRSTRALAQVSGLELGRRMLGAFRFESRTLGKHPKRARQLDAHLEQRLGFVPGYLRHFHGSRVRRTLSHLLVDRIAESPGSLGPDLCAAMCMVAAKVSKNRLLRAHFATIGARVSSPKLLRELLLNTQGDSRSALALRFAERAASVPHRIDKLLVRELTGTFSPQEIIELTLSVGVYSALHRLTLSYPQTHLEPEVEALVREHGTELELEQLD
jgi:alkylhydroperoxidase family enzyme